MADLANILQTYGGWGVSAILVYACTRLYRDLRETEKARLTEAQEYGNRLHIALTDAVGIVKTIQDDMEARQ